MDISDSLLLKLLSSMSKLEMNSLTDSKDKRPCVLERNPIKEIAKENTRDSIKFMVT